LAGAADGFLQEHAAKGLDHRCGGVRGGRDHLLILAALVQVLGALPGPASFDLHLQRKAEEGPDQHDSGKHREAVEVRLDRDGVDDIGRDQKLEPEQDRAPEVGAEDRSQRLLGSSPPQVKQKCRRAPAAPIYDDRDPAISTARVIQ
jgi:hypothetical protein